MFGGADAEQGQAACEHRSGGFGEGQPGPVGGRGFLVAARQYRDRKSTRLNSSHSQISYAVFCLKKKKHIHPISPWSGKIIAWSLPTSFVHVFGIFPLTPTVFTFNPSPHRRSHVGRVCYLYTCP